MILAPVHEAIGRSQLFSSAREIKGRFRLWANPTSRSCKNRVSTRGVAAKAQTRARPFASKEVALTLEVWFVRSHPMVILLSFACILSGFSAAASPVAVRYKEGLTHGFLVLSTL